MQSATMQTITLHTSNPTASLTQPLRHCVQQALQDYFNHLGNQNINNLYELVLAEVETPLIETVLRQTRGNQCKAAVILGLSRGTLRKKLRQYNITT